MASRSINCKMDGGFCQGGILPESTLSGKYGKIMLFSMISRGADKCRFYDLGSLASPSGQNDSFSFQANGL